MNIPVNPELVQKITTFLGNKGPFEVTDSKLHPDDREFFKDQGGYIDRIFQPMLDDKRPSIERAEELIRAFLDPHSPKAMMCTKLFKPEVLERLLIAVASEVMAYRVHDDTIIEGDLVIGEFISTVKNLSTSRMLAQALDTGSNMPMTGSLFQLLILLEVNCILSRIINFPLSEDFAHGKQSSPGPDITQDPATPT